MADLIDAAGVDVGEGSAAGKEGEGATAGATEGTNPGEGQEGQGQKGEGTPPSGEGESLWFWDDKQPGEGERPEFLKENFKTVAAQAKAYQDLEKKFGGFKGAPEDYDLNIPDLNENIKLSAEDPVLKEFMSFAKESNMSQETFNGVMHKYIGVMTANLTDPKAEMEKLGLNAKEEISRVATIANKNLSPDEYSKFRGLMTTADNIRIFNKLLAKQTAPEISTGRAAQTGETKAELEKMMMDDRYYKDEDFRNMVRGKLTKLEG